MLLQFGRRLGQLGLGAMMGILALAWLLNGIVRADTTGTVPGTTDVVFYVGDEQNGNNNTSRTNLNTQYISWTTIVSNAYSATYPNMEFRISPLTLTTGGPVAAGNTPNPITNRVFFSDTAYKLSFDVDVRNVTDTNTGGSAGTSNVSLSVCNVLQGNSPCPAMLRNNPDYAGYTENIGETSSPNGLLFTFSQPVRAFGAWFADIETAVTGTLAFVRLFDETGTQIGNDMVITPTDTTCENAPGGTATARCFGNTSTRWIGFHVLPTSTTRVKSMLIVVGDDDPGGSGGSEHLGFIGMTVAYTEPGPTAVSLQKVQVQDVASWRWTGVLVSVLGLATAVFWRRSRRNPDFS